MRTEDEEKVVITELYIRKFGTLSDRHFCLGEGLQIISGDNEFGKTTLHGFIRAMLFGLERGRGRAAANDDFSRYEPWGDPGSYGGVMRFTCGGRHFRLERDFARHTRRASLICEDDGEELSVDDGDLEMLLNGMTAGVFDSTVSVGQLKAEPGRELAEALADYAANYFETGGEYNLSGALQILAGKQREAERELRVENDAVNAIRMDLQREVRYLEEDIQHLKEEYTEKKACLEELGEAEVWNSDAENINRKKCSGPMAAGGTVLLLAGAVSVLCSTLAEGIPAITLFAGTLSLIAGMLLVIRGIRGGVCFRNTDERAGRKCLHRNPTERRERLNGELDHIRRAYREKEIQYENLQEQLEEYGKSGRQIRLEQRCRALELAAERLQQAAKTTGDGMERRISGRMSEIFARITDGRYRSVEAGRTKAGFRITVWDGERRIPSARLSRGTVEQLYFSLRMAAADVLLEEPFPVILDDVFAFYDDKRLESVLQWLSREKEQVILLTCHHREERILNKLV